MLALLFMAATAAVATLGLYCWLAARDRRELSRLTAACAGKHREPSAKRLYAMRLELDLERVRLPHL